MRERFRFTNDYKLPRYMYIYIYVVTVYANDGSMQHISLVSLLWCVKVLTLRLFLLGNKKVTIIYVPTTCLCIWPYFYLEIYENQSYAATGC